MRQRKSVSGRRGRLAKVGFLTAALSLLVASTAVAVPEGPAGENTPEGVPPTYTGSENPGSEHMPEGVPPEQAPAGQPEGVPVGPPEGTPVGPPEGTPVGPPEGVPPGYNGTENPGVSHRPSGHEARALGREQCGEFKKNFRQNKSQFGRCIADVAKALRAEVAPGRACKGMNRRRQEGQSRSDFSACVKAAARALRE
jgi:hypothetical protein